ncbi:HlyD family secretion protein [Tundrisphaera sp. TA3]|uniref:HlyD family secretion protein n=1 Tax=Tundrisphaera sp. TA3 TaxID=3435775 RepID=UPI003EC00A31
MIRKLSLPLLALSGLLFAIFTIVQARQEPPAYQPTTPPPTRPGPVRSIAGAGLVEPKLENIPIGAPTSGVVTEVLVKIGDKVEKGAPLFQLDDREWKADLLVRKAALAASEAQYERLKNAPRAEDLPPAEAMVEEATAKLSDAETALGRSDRLFQRQMYSAGDLDRDRFAYAAAKATLARARADLAKLKAGTWGQDLDVARSAVQEARAQVERVKLNLDRLTVRALTAGQVLQVNVRPGQFAAAVWKEPLIVLGDVGTLHVRVDVDENDLHWFDPKARAVATLKGRPNVRFNDLRLVKVEPYVIPKKSLTGDNSERVDTRVLQVVYALPDEKQVPIFVGQQMDVYIEAAKLPEGLNLDAGVGRPFAAE